MALEAQFYELVWMWIKLPHIFAKRIFSAVIDGTKQTTHHTAVNRRVISKSSRSLRILREYITVSKERCEAIFYELSSDDSNSDDLHAFVPLSSCESFETDASCQCRILVSYRILLQDGHMRVDVLSSQAPVKEIDQLSFLSRSYIETTLRSQLEEFWRKLCLNQGISPPTLAQMDGSVIEPRSLVQVDHAIYYAKYLELKRKYAQLLATNWCERTSPEKFIHEELAIAAYLISLWSQIDPSMSVQSSVHQIANSCNCECACKVIRGSHQGGAFKHPSFVDLGCGNGMLVFVLNSEGYAGVGVDVRERRSWCFYREQVGADKLLTLQLNPAQYVLASSADACKCGCQWPFAACEWLIGNHADELSCWLPVLAARFSHSGFFLLPCCPYELSGARFSYRRPNESLYRTFLRYVHHVSYRCGYSNSLRHDRLRIPSTKRICYVGTTTSRISEDYASLISDRDFHRQLAAVSYDLAMDDVEEDNGAGEDNRHDHEQPAKQIQHSPSSCASGPFQMQLRGSVEPVRNCAGLPAEFKRSLLVKIVMLLLSAPDARFINLHNTASIGALVVETSQPSPNDSEVNAIRRWNAGGTLRLNQLAAELSHEELQQLKAQCGGLQTFVRNNRHVVKCEKTVVSLSEPVSKLNCEKDEKRQRVLALKPCWFADNHPDGCLYTASACACAHNVDFEIR